MAHFIVIIYRSEKIIRVDQRPDPAFLLPNTSEITKRTRKTTNRILAIDAAPAAIPPKPKTAAMMAIIRKATDQRSIIIKF